jgi:hypothetical protein
METIYSSVFEMSHIIRLFLLKRLVSVSILETWRGLNVTLECFCPCSIMQLEYWSTAAPSISNMYLNSAHTRNTIVIAYCGPARRAPLCVLKVLGSNPRGACSDVEVFFGVCPHHIP